MHHAKLFPRSLIHPYVYNKQPYFYQIQMLTLKQTGNLRQNSHIPINKQTDQLYEPLRAALRKSTLDNGYLTNDLRATFANSSSLAKKIRLLTPTEAENIKNGIFIPTNKALVPTRNIQKVLGKNFTQVDVSERVGEPLTPEQFNLKRHGGVSEIVYEITDDDNPYQLSSKTNLYTSRGNYPTSPRPSRQLASSAPYIADTRPIHNPLEDLPKPLFMSHSSKDLIPGRQMTISLANSPSESSNLPTGVTSPRKYQFKQSLRGSQSKQQGQDEYRYNLFSVIDEACNNSCHKGCCADSNQIIASKINSNPWA